MQRTFIDEPYVFLPPWRGPRLARVLDHLLIGPYLRRAHRVVDVRCDGVEHLRRSVDRGHACLLLANHTRVADPFVLCYLSRAAREPLYGMASWHSFRQGRLSALAARGMGAFSVYREGRDRAAVRFSIEVLQRAERPLVMFPEGILTRTNDRLNPLLDGPAVIARSAARQRAAGGRPGVVIHPVALRYSIEGDPAPAFDEALGALERRLGWSPRPGRPPVERAEALVEAYGALKEVEHRDATREGDGAARRRELIEELLEPLESEWSVPERARPKPPTVAERCQSLRARIIPDLVAGRVDAGETARRRRLLNAVDSAQQLSYYPEAYLGPSAPHERILETIERLEEDLTGAAGAHVSLSATVRVGEALEVPPERGRRDAVDELLGDVEGSLRALLGIPARAPASWGAVPGP